MSTQVYNINRFDLQECGILLGWGLLTGEGGSFLFHSMLDSHWYRL